jgi:FAD synthase
MDIYGKNISVLFRERLRDEIKFENTKQLAEQMELDKRQVLELLK